MTQAAPSRSAPVETPWQACPGLRAGAIDGAASLIIMEVLVNALSRLPGGQDALATACRQRVQSRPDEEFGISPIDVAAGALALALIEASRCVVESPGPAANTP
jgi:hypothetical protein